MYSPSDQADRNIVASRLPLQFHQASRAIALFVVGLGLVAFCGWAFHIPTLTYIHPALQSMKVNTALSFLFLGAALWLAENDERQRSRRILGLLVVIIAGATLAEYAFHVRLGIDQFLFRDTRSPSLSAFPGRMAISTAICFLFLGSSIMLLAWKKALAARQLLVAACFAFSLAALLGYLYGVKSLYSITSFSTIGVHTSAGLMAVCVAYFLSRPNEGIVAIAASNTNAGLILRRLIPPIIVFPTLIGWVRLEGERAGLYDAPFGVALLVLGTIGSLSVLALLSARLMHRLEAERLRVDKALHDSEERLRLAQWAAHIGTFDVNLRTGVDIWPPETEALYGLPPGGFGGTLAAFENLIHPQDRERVIQLTQEMMRTGQPAEAEWRVIWPDGSVHWIASRGQVLRGEAGERLRMLGVNIDVTERKQAEEALVGMTRKLIDAQEQERARIGRELHDDINQRLAMLAVECGQLQDDPSDVQVRMRELRQELAHLSDDVQALSHELHSSKLDYLGVVAGIKSWCKEFGERQRMEIGFKSDVHSVLRSDVGLTLFRVLQEALHNVAKHSGVKRVEVQLLEHSNAVHLIVSDSGQGFDVEAALQGNGLGLTSMSERIRLLKGTIAIESRPMSGTTVRVSLPLDSEHRSELAG